MTDPLGLLNQTGGVGDLRPMKPTAPVTRADGPSFKDVLMDNIKRVNDLQLEAEKATEDLFAGRRDDIANVNIAKQKSDLAFQMLLQVRNKMLDAYDEVKQLRV
ncbi:MAG: flagellar hook-basal body complex protein FliE [Planctomycetota bacterium]|jgi:flagellar hook-basal body complex protein FliE